MLSNPLDNPTAVFAAIRGYALFSSRQRLLRYFLSAGWTVVAATAPDRYSAELEKMGVKVEPVHFKRGGLSPFPDFHAWRRLLGIYRRHRPLLVHHFQLKPILVGTSAARVATSARIVNTITGLGTSLSGKGLSSLLLAWAYRLLLSKRQVTIFQNPENQDLFIRQGWVQEAHSRLIVSSGVDLERFRPAATWDLDRPPQLLLAARLIWDKGIREYVQAARLIQLEYPDARLALAGEWDRSHSRAVPEEWLRREHESGRIHFLRHVGDMPALLQETDIVVLPTFYGEGVPRVLLEAAACGLPVVATDVPGCREAVVDGETGFLVPPKNPDAIAEAGLRLLNDPALRARMGAAGRSHMEKHFGIQHITEQYLSVYRDVAIEIQ